MRRLGTIIAAAAVAATLAAGCGSDGGSDKKVSTDPNSPDHVNPDLIKTCQEQQHLSAETCREIWGH